MEGSPWSLQTSGQPIRASCLSCGDSCASRWERAEISHAQAFVDREFRSTNDLVWDSSRILLVWSRDFRWDEKTAFYPLNLFLTIGVSELIVMFAMAVRSSGGRNYVGTPPSLRGIPAQRHPDNSEGRRKSLCA